MFFFLELSIPKPTHITSALFVHTETYDPLAEVWIKHTSFIYADGTNVPPARLRDEPAMNYLDPNIRLAGLTLMSIALLCVLSSVIWVFRRRNHSVVIAAQPVLLYTLCLGSAMVALVILLTSYDESYGWDEEMLTKACVGSIWLDVLGNIIALGALFTKVSGSCRLFSKRISCRLILSCRDCRSFGESTAACCIRPPIQKYGA